MFDDLICMLKKNELDEFILTITNQDLKIEGELLKFDIVEIYRHILVCDIHNRFFADYIDNFKKSNRNPHLLTQNIQYLRGYIRNYETSTTN